jgi:hypothetical protein
MEPGSINGDTNAGAWQESVYIPFLAKIFCALAERNTKSLTPNTY